MGSRAIRRAALDARQHRSALRRLLAGLAEPTSEQRLDQLRCALDETQAASTSAATLTLQAHCSEPSGGTAARKRPFEDAEAPPTLIPRFRLLLPEEESLSILAVAVPQGPEGVVAVFLSSGMLELWKADPICWHLASCIKVPLPRLGARGTLTFSRSGKHLWLVTSCEGPLYTRLFECMGGALQLLGVLQGPAQEVLAGPALLSPNGLAVGLNEVHVLCWTGEALEIVSSSSASLRYGLWPLPPLGEEPRQWRMLLHCHEGRLLRLCNGVGDCLASVQLTAAHVVVPPQDPNPQCPGSFVLLIAGPTDWTLHCASDQLKLQGLGPLCPAEGPVEVSAVSEGSVAFESHGSLWLLDWQPRELHALPPDWRPVALKNGLLILERAGCELLFLEPN